MSYTYILYSEALDKYYVGFTSSSVQERLEKHLSDHAGFTGQIKDWQVVWSREFEDSADARAFERKIKKWKSKKAIEKLVGG